jgi:hypothetical protein
VDAMMPVPALRPSIADVTLMRPDGALPLVHLPDTATALVSIGAIVNTCG